MYSTRVYSSRLSRETMPHLCSPGLLCPSLCVDIGSSLLSVGGSRQDYISQIGSLITMVTYKYIQLYIQDMYTNFSMQKCYPCIDTCTCKIMHTRNWGYYLHVNILPSRVSFFIYLGRQQSSPGECLPSSTQRYPIKAANIKKHNCQPPLSLETTHCSQEVEQLCSFELCWFETRSVANIQGTHLTRILK